MQAHRVGMRTILIKYATFPVKMQVLSICRTITPDLFAFFVSFLPKVDGICLHFNPHFHAIIGLSRSAESPTVGRSARKI